MQTFLFAYLFGLDNYNKIFLYIYTSKMHITMDDGNRAQPLKRIVDFACVPIYIFGLHHKQCASD